MSAEIRTYLFIQEKGHFEGHFKDIVKKTTKRHSVGHGIRSMSARSVSILAILLATVIWQQQRCPIMINGSAETVQHATEQVVPDGCSVIGKDPFKIVCVCNEQKCNDLTFEWPRITGEALLVETTRSGLRFAAKPLKIQKGTPIESVVSESSKSVLVVDVNDQQQEVLGWGGAFTDAATINIQSLSSELSGRLIESYFGPNGLQYNFGRVPISGSDFSTRAYSYDDSNEPDLNLTNWSLAEEDLKYKIPIIKRAIEVAQRDGTKLKLFASTWSPPKWMKTSNSLVRGHLIDKDEIYRSYANYLIKFYQSYKKNGIEFWGATVQNEPAASYFPFYFFNSLQMSSAQTIKFVANYLGPALESFGYTKQNFKLMVGDDSLGLINHQVPSIMENKQVQKYVSGLAFHWYLSGTLVSYNSLTHLVNKIKDKLEFVMMSESCEGAYSSLKHVSLGDWERAESYASDIIEDFRRQTGAWIDWNLALDLEGGPNWAGNHVDSPVIVDSKKNEFIKQPMYYSLAHFSRFMRPGSVVVGSSTRDMEDVSVIAAYLKSSVHLVVNVLNKCNEKKKFPLEVKNAAQTLYHSIVELEPKSVNTIVLKL